MKSAAGTIRLDLAQYREMEVFTQFSSDLDETTKRQLTYGQGLMRLLRQPQYHPMKQHEQVITLVSALSHVMQDLPIGQIKDFQSFLLDHAEKEEPQLCQRIDQQGRLSDDDRALIVDFAKKALEAFSAQNEKKQGD